jgi:hypothetical protein
MRFVRISTMIDKSDFDEDHEDWEREGERKNKNMAVRGFEPQQSRLHWPELPLTTIPDGHSYHA